MHEAVFKNSFRDLGGALRHRVEGHELGLHVGRETRVFGGAKTLRAQPAVGLHPDAVSQWGDGNAGVAQLLNHRFQMLGAAVAQEHVAASGGHGAQKGAGLYAVSHHLVRGAVQPGHTLDADAAAAMAFDAGAHGDQHLGQVGDLRLLRGVFQDGFAVGQAGGHQKILGAGDGDHIGGDAGAAQPRQARRQARHHVAVLDLDFGAHGAQALDVLVHRARTDGAAARQ